MSQDEITCISNNLCIVSFKTQVSEQFKSHVVIVYFLHEISLELEHFHLLTFTEFCICFSAMKDWDARKMFIWTNTTNVIPLQKL